MAIRVGSEFSHYRVLDEIGQGGMGVVYRAEDNLRSHAVAIKVLNRDAAVDPDVERRFKREAGAGAGLVHPSIVQIYDSGCHEGQQFIVLEFVDGRNLRDTLASGPLPPPQVVEIGIAAGDALQLAHDHGIVHRDIKAENIMITRDGVVKVMDFGLAKIQNASLLTQEGDVVGTVAYMSPEQATGERVDNRTDIFSLGVVLYELLTGKLPFWAAYDTAIIYSILNSEPAPIRDLAPGVPEALDRIVMKAIRKDRGDRYQNMREMINDLARMKSFFDGERDVMPSPLELAAGSGETRGETRSSQVRMEARGEFTPVLAGREKEFAALKQRLEDAAGGRCCLAFITGEAGVGKTRLADELAMFARTLRVRILRGECLPGGRGHPYQPVSEALRRFLHDQGIDTAEEFGRFANESLPEAGRHTGLLNFFLHFCESPPEELTSREQLWGSVSSFLTAAAAARPILLFIDDLHWADEETLLLLGYIGRMGGNSRMLIVGTYRSGEVAAGPDDDPTLLRVERDLSCGDRFERIVLGRLDPAAVSAVIGSLFPDHEFGEGFAASMFRETEGNPFFLMEILKLLRMEGVISKCEGKFRIREDFETVSIPRSVQDIVMRRIDRLDASEREILEIGAVEGDSFHSGTVGSVLETNRVRLLRTLQSLERDHHIIHAEGKTYRFDHGKIREFLYRSITPELRIEFHRMIGGYLEETFGDDERMAADISHHLLSGEEEEKAFPHLVRAGERARRFYANARAVELYLRALGIGRRMERSRGGDEITSRLLTVTEGLADVWSLTGRYREAMERYTQLSSYPFVSGWRKTELLRKMGGIYERLGDNERALEVLSRAETEIEGGEYPPNDGAGIQRALGRIRITRSRVLKSLGRYADAEQEIGRGLDMMRAAGNENDLADAYKNLGTIYEDMGRFDQAAEMYGKDLETRQKIGDRKGLAVAHNNLANVYADEGDYARTADALQKSLDIMTEIGYREGIAGACNNLGSVFQDQGRYEEALAMHQRCLSLRTEMDDRPDMAMSYGNLGSVRINMGDFGGARADLEENLKISREIGFRIFESQVHAWLAIVYMNLSLPDRAREAAVRALETAEEMGQRHQLAVAKRTMGSLLMAGISIGSPGPADPVREAEGPLLESLSIFEELGMKHEAGRSRLELAHLYDRKGDAELCRTHLLGAKSIFQKLGAFGDLAAANKLHPSTH